MVKPVILADSTRLRVFFLLPFAPRLDSRHGGGRVISQFIEEISARHKIAVLYLRGQDEPPADEFFRARCEWIEEVIRPWTEKSLKQRWFRYLRLLKALFRLQPMWVADWASKSYADRVRSMVLSFHPDIIQIEYHVMGQYLTALHEIEAPKVLTIHEAGIRAAPFIRRQVPLAVGRMVSRLEKFFWQRYETRIIRQVEAVVTFTEADRQAIEKLAGQVPVVKIPPGTRIAHHPLDPVGQPPLSLLFTGNFIHPPNTDAAIRLIRDIFPGVVSRFPEAKLYIVGEEPPSNLRKLASENIVITGSVSDITPYMNQAALFIAPLRQGGGIRIKVMEALAAGKAIVTSPLAIQGLTLADRDQVWVAHSDSEFCDAIIHLIADPEERSSLAKRARIWAIANINWEKSIADYQSLYSSLIENTHRVEYPI